MRFFRVIFKGMDCKRNNGLRLSLYLRVRLIFNVKIGFEIDISRFSHLFYWNDSTWSLYLKVYYMGIVILRLLIIFLLFLKIVSTTVLFDLSYYLIIYFIVSRNNANFCIILS